MAELAGIVAGHLPGWRVGGATLACAGAIDRAVATLGSGLVVYPLFMSDGWFVREQLPKRMAAAGAADVRILAPLGLDPALSDLCLSRARDAAIAGGLEPARTMLLLVGHGSPSNSRASAPVRAAAGLVAQAGVFRGVTTGFVDEAPFVADAARDLGPAVCLPYFAAANGHVREDIPEALLEAGFEGVTLDPIGTDPAVPEMIAHALEAAVAAGPCGAGGRPPPTDHLGAAPGETSRRRRDRVAG